MGPEVGYIYNSLEDIVNNVMGNRQESCKNKEIENVRKKIIYLNKLHAASPSVKLAAEIKEVGCKLSKLIRDKFEQDMKDLRLQQSGSKCKCVTDQHIRTNHKKPYDPVTNPNGFTTDRSGPHNICTLDWTDENKKEWIIEHFRLNSNNELKRDKKTKENLIKLLVDRWESLSVTKSDYGLTSLGQIRLRLKEGAIPYRGKLRPLNPRLYKSLQDQLHQWLKAGVIEPTTSEWGSVLLCVTKNGKDRWCLDYRILNQNLKKDSFPLPNIRQNLHRLAGSRIFSALDATSAFQALMIEESSRDLTSFISEFGVFRFI